MHCIRPSPPPHSTGQALIWGAVIIGLSAGWLLLTLLCAAGSILALDPHPDHQG